MNKVIFFVAGGTGGHLFPAIAVAKSFEKSQSHFLVDKRTEKIIIDELQKAHPDFGFVTEETGIINQSNIKNIDVKKQEKKAVKK